MKLKRISWKNYRALKDGEIVADGHRVEISGRNGAGKSSIASVIPFVLFGKIAAKGFDENGLTVASQIPEAELEFVDGTKFRRVITHDGKNHTYVDGYEMSAGAFNAQVFKFTNGGGALLFNLFEFPAMNWKDQRNFLLANFTDVREDLPSSDELHSRVKNINTEIITLDARIQEIYSQLNEIPDMSIKDIDAELAELDAKIKTLDKAQRDGESNLELKRNVVANLSRQLNFHMQRRKSFAFDREELLKKYRAVSTTCPTCGAPMPAERVKKARDEIVALGRQAAQKASEAQACVEQLSSQLEAAKAELTEAERADREFYDQEHHADLLELESRRDFLREMRAQVGQRQKLTDRITELDDKRKQLRVQLEDLKGELETVASRRQQLIRKKESDVNSRFDFVTFKLFKILSTTGEARETCEPMLNGVPYANLSKGEKFKAACDILNALQKHFGTEMPLVVDDAESYTPNSILKLKNQLLLFTVTESDLKVVVTDD